MFAAWVADVRFFKGDGRGGASYKLTLDDRSAQLATWIDADKWAKYASFVKADQLVFASAEIGLSPAREGREAEPRLYAPEFYSLDDVLRSEEHTSELQSLMRISYAVFCLKK